MKGKSVRHQPFHLSCFPSDLNPESLLRLHLRNSEKIDRKNETIYLIIMLKSFQKMKQHLKPGMNILIECN